MINIEEFKSQVIQNAISGRICSTFSKIDSRDYLKERKINYCDDGPFSIPKHWTWVKCKEICNLLGGFAFKSEKYTHSTNGVRVIRISDFNNNGLVNTEIVKYPYDSSLDSYEIFENDILMCMTGGTVGKSCLFPRVEYRCFLNQRVALFRSTVIDIRFLYYVLKSRHILSVINNTKRSTNDNISMKIIGDFDVPFPPLEEQKQIVSKLDEIFEELDKIDEKQIILQSIQEKIESKILKLAIQGKLVEQRPEEGTGQELFNLIQNEKQQLIKEGKIKKEKTLPAIEDSEIPFDIPSTWKWLRLSDICEIPITDGTHKTPTYSTKEEGVPFISSKDVTGKFIDWSNIKYITKSLHEELYKRIAPQKDDVLLAKNGTIGVAALVEDDRIFDIYVTLAVLRPMKNMIFPKYLLYVVNSSVCKNQFNAHLIGIGVPNLHLNVIKEVLVPLPPYEEQKRIVAKIEELLPLCKIID